MGTLGAVVVGTGFGGRVHVPALRGAGFEVVGLVGRDAERTARRARRLGIPRALDSFEAALALPDVDAVTIATPPSTHAPLAIAAARAGKHVVCEKPFALDTGQAREMLDAAEGAGVVHLVGHEFRWSPDRALLGRALRDGLIGEPRLFTLLQEISLVAGPDPRMPSWWFDEHAGGGWLGAAGSHVVDQIRVWLGEIDSVSAAVGVVAGRDVVGGADDTFSVRLRMASGVDGVLQQSGGVLGPSINITRVVGSRGTLSIEGDAVVLGDASGVRALPVPDDLALAPIAESDDPRHEFTHLELGPYTRLCQALRAGIEGRPITSDVPLPTFADGVACMRVLDAIRESAARGGATIRLSPDR